MGDGRGIMKVIAEDTGKGREHQLLRRMWPITE